MNKNYHCFPPGDCVEFSGFDNSGFLKKNFVVLIPLLKFNFFTSSFVTKNNSNAIKN